MNVGAGPTVDRKRLSELITNFKKVQVIHKNHPTDRENKNLLKHAPYSSITERWTGRGGSKS